MNGLRNTSFIVVWVGALLFSTTDTKSQSQAREITTDPDPCWAATLFGNAYADDFGASGTADFS